MKRQNLSSQVDNYIFNFHMSVYFQTSCNKVWVLEGNKGKEGTNKGIYYYYISIDTYNSYFKKIQ